MSEAPSPSFWRVPMTPREKYVAREFLVFGVVVGVVIGAFCVAVAWLLVIA